MSFFQRLCPVLSPPVSMGVTLPLAKKCQGSPENHQDLGERQRRDSTPLPPQLQKEPNLLTPQSETSSLQNCERIDSCCLSHLKWYFFNSSWETDENPTTKGSVKKECWWMSTLYFDYFNPALFLGKFYVSFRSSHILSSGLWASLSLLRYEFPPLSGLSFSPLTRGLLFKITLVFCHTLPWSDGFSIYCLNVHGLERPSKCKERVGGSPYIAVICSFAGSIRKVGASLVVR